MTWRKIVIFFLFIIIGSFLGSMLVRFLGSHVGILAYSSSGYGLEPPLVLNLGVLELTIGVKIHLSVGSLIGILVALVVYSRL